ncbi:hypothetical protein S101447_02687 [Acetobacter ascendens]|uniref:Uncharacterized protein n=1 Tax=Acetobacter ascendens TaxID=481146 RepID=A0A1Y0V169_9PROT|nr:hypothetical protein S101447_02687 [Acetobacter ascendens]
MIRINSKLDELRHRTVEMQHILVSRNAAS